VLRSAGILDIEVDAAGAEAIASRSRGTPRVANRLLKRVRDFAEVRGAGHIDARIVLRSAGILDVEIDSAGAEAIAARSRGTPRVANRLLKRVRDFAEVRGAGHIDADIAAEALDLLEVDAAGLDRLDRAILRSICEKFGGGPVGLSTLAVAVGEEPDTVEEVYEPYLLQQGYLMRTPRGRVATDSAFAHLGLEPPRGAGQRLF